ncbi:acetolactate decarboxylase [Rahnella sp. C60]|uniref:acetolactate decarboxylase n=1 Tax=Rahnella TaxID=34037 RepID=UPI001C27C5A2|nr:acetolactate decarboxylase [Rahnella perminowiae]MBU9809816.1 acetolactate decarboxylase [Rahnella perminowiae]MBU9815935.1 acetolactate decarboxylase [Rahnella perminowiae]MCX2943942.1 acetolactate decarboxylase [Rahnella perminowiae]UJD91037.1 acetolactate decarboxylase [Rahnella aquatilis]
MKSHSESCSCVADIARTATAFKQQHPDRVLYQSSLMSALLSGVYEGDTTMAELLKHGDFGLGTFNRLDGELIAFNSNIFQLRGDGSARRAKPEQKTPFAVMTFFNPTNEYVIDRPHSREQIHAVIDNAVASQNTFCALRIDGEFSRVETRTVPEQHRPYKPMLEAIEAQPTFHIENSQGVLIGFLTPAYMQGINVAGYHEHFINQTRSSGGHVLDYQVECGVLTFGTVEKLLIDFPQDSDFLHANLCPDDLNDAIQSVES